VTSDEATLLLHSRRRIGRALDGNGFKTGMPRGMLLGHPEGRRMQPAHDDIDFSIEATHNALFETWFPFDDLPIPPAVRGDIAGIAQKVRAGMFQAFQQSPGIMFLLTGMTAPSKLPFYDCLKQSADPAVQSFLTSAGGFGGMPVHQRAPLFSFLFEATCGAITAQIAMQLRELYLSGIWDLPLAVPLTGIQSPTVFMEDTAIYAKLHAPELPPSPLRYDAATRRIFVPDGQIDYLVIGSGPGGATVAHELCRAGKRTVLIEKGPFVVWGSMDTRSYPRLMFQGDRATTADNGIIIRSGETVGGGTTVNIDLAFSPLEATVQARIDEWRKRGLIDAEHYTTDRLSAAYEWVRAVIATRELSQSELNRDNLVLWNGAKAFGVDPSLYHLNRFPQQQSPSPVDDKRDATRQLIVPAMQRAANPLSVIPDATVDAVRFAPAPDGKDLRAVGVTLTMTAPWTDHHNTLVDPCRLGIPPGTQVTIDAANVVLAAGTIGTTRILLDTARSVPEIANPLIGKGLILHPSMPLIGQFDYDINLLRGLDSATFVAAFGVVPGFIFETMSGLPAYGALLVPGDGRQVYENLVQFNRSAGFGVMLVDTPSPSNCVTLDASGEPAVSYALSESDKQRFRIGVAAAVRMMFLAGARQVILPTNENVLGRPDFDPMRGVYLTRIEEADLVERNLQFVPNRTVLTAAHLQATNKMGPSPDVAVVSTRQRVWNVVTRGEVPNLYVMDSSMFPTSVGANPMQSLYTFARIFSERLIHGMDHGRAVAREASPARPAPAVLPRPQPRAVDAMAPWTDDQVMFTLAYLAYDGESSTDPTAVMNALTTDLASVAPLGGQWQLAWGPTLFKFSLSELDDNMWYVARNTTTGELAVAIRGTNFDALLDWIVEDFWVTEQVAWPYHHAAGASIARGTAFAIDKLLTVTPAAGIPGAGQTLTQFLAAQAAAGALTVGITGHSLGGCLSSTLALALKDIQDRWSPRAAPVVRSWSFAGPTVGNAEFARYSDARLGTALRRWVNALDIAPHAWNESTLDSALWIYADYGIWPSALEIGALLLAKTLAAGGGYHQPSVGAVNQDGSWNLTPGYQTYSAQAAWQHGQGYAAILGLSNVLPKRTATAATAARVVARLEVLRARARR
jgi:hypothetical protein